jgi:subtilase family serine protease
LNKGITTTAAAAFAIAAMIAGAAVSSGSAATRSRKVVDASPAAATAKRDRGKARGAVNFSVVLGWRDAGALKALDNAVSDPSSPDYGRYLSPAQFRSRFSPTAADIASVKGFLRRGGFQVGNVSKARMLVQASGTVAQAERAFNTDLRTYRIGGHKLIEAASPVSVPATLADKVVGIDGLNQALARPLATAPPAPVFLQAKPCSKWWAQRFTFNQPRAYGQQQPWIVCGYAGSQMQDAYDVGGNIGLGNDGSGQTVAIVDAFASPTIVQDIQTYSQKHGLPPATVQQTVFKPCKTHCSVENQQGWYGEETLDFDAVHTMAPGAAIHYFGATDSGNGLDDALAFIVDHHSASIVTNSYGFLGENVGTSQVTTQIQIDQEAIAQGIGVYFSSGDGGDEKTSIGYVSTDFPASSPYVTAVGGTSLGVGPTDNYRFETGWGTFRADAKKGKWKPHQPGAFYYGGGGGTSRLFTEPSYQQGIVPSALSDRYGGHGRVVPDVSMDGDPTTGLATGQSQAFPNGKVKYAEARYGGTSLSSPLFAGIMALADQNAGFSHGFANPALYALAGTGAYRDVLPSPTRLAAVRRDFVNGVNGSRGKTLSLRSLDMDSSLRTTVGYDNVTGIGSPFGAAFISAMATP